MLAVIEVPVDALHAAAAAGGDVALKVTLLLVAALALGQAFLRQRPFAQAAVYHATWVGLILLPLAAFALPHFAVAVLPATATVAPLPQSRASNAHTPPPIGLPEASSSTVLNLSPF